MNKTNATSLNIFDSYRSTVGGHWPLAIEQSFRLILLKLTYFSAQKTISLRNQGIYDKNGVSSVNNDDGHKPDVFKFYN